MNYSSRVLIGHIVISTCIFLFSVIGFTIASCAIKLTFSVMAWLSDGNFNLPWDEVLRSIKIGGIGGGVLGIGIIMFRFFKVKGF
ncbi:hypothetical protein JZQ46_004427 [Salmonella enterica subsp. enterica serovar Panama]|uniref:hypothetical protein n=1 Tax=Salmonella enterica TaxID=28901 RepID=UPI00111A3C9E|nr:hypothetical protein [Salmonella enterica]EEC0711573.1 hypothetical protein [Salmonella enterica subsp. enterica]EEN5142515.1 hypothetical protein [Salmonella enterica subsp. enterica serovar Oranienburg]EHF2631022.1 hypothetical protein [Salmonella enterica subsp. enterica serovar Panama]QVB78641.1 hypothetical protein JYM78_23290 [Salmonella enterica subsp. enterica serovar Rubislaw]HCK5321726.1 hypothetical protein [Salmonella enterica subsp. enterica serovar Manhattan]